ncbi:tail fiber protein [uncultured Aquimarina sp.]|uniref:tail fiber protein n=1 Tax=uncultured Aquimarina sp. TaxID=575652 RepID=UPI00261800F4|nr:tail fiber protein [uncultured Aquimarina sp.]
MRKNIAFIILIIGAIYSLKAQTQTQDLNMGLHQLQFPSANGGFNRIHSFGGTFPGKWLFKSRFDHIYLDAGENENNKYSILFLSGGIERARLNGAGNFGIGTSNPTSKFHVVHTSGQGFAPVISGNIATFQTNASAGYYSSINVISGTEGRASFYFGDRDSGAMGGFRYNNANNSLTFRTNGADNRMFINSSGNIGIGTTNPGSKLEIKSNSGETESFMKMSVSDAPSDYLQVSNATGGANRFLPLIKGNVQSSNISSLLFIASTDAVNDNNGSSSMMRFDTRRSSNDQGIATRPLFQWTNFDQKLMTMTANGNVGIGTTNPIEKLKIVNGSISVDSSSDGSNAFEFGNNYGQMYYDAQSSGEQNRGMYFQEQLSTNRGFHFLNSNGDRLLKINGNGNVGIGTNSPDAKLAVNGNIHTQEVKVDLVGWPDYVFEEDYNLPTLQEVEQHISEQGHLENIPSAAEVAENGIQLGEMNKKLLEKIEQLTLYMIEQNKKTDFLLKEVETLKKKNAALEARLK